MMGVSQFRMSRFGSATSSNFVAQRGILTLLLGFVANDLVIFRKVGRELTFEACALLRAQLPLLVAEIGDVRLQPMDLVPDAIGDLLVVLGGLFRGLDELGRRCRGGGLLRQVW